MRSQHSGGHRRCSCPAVAALLAVALFALAMPASGAEASRSGLTSDEVAAEILRVQGIADQTAAEWAATNLRSEVLASELAAADVQLGETSARLGKLEDDLAKIAVARFTSASSSSMVVLFDEPGDEMQASALRQVALDVGATDLDEIDSIRSEHADALATIQALNDENIQVVEELATRETRLDEQLADLAALREQLQDDEVLRAYERQLAAQRAEQAEQAAQAARAAAAATTIASAPPPKGAGAQPATAAAVAPPSSPPSTEPPSPATPRVPAVTAPATPDSTDPEPPPRPPAPVVVDVGSGWVCPVAGPTAFGDTWGAPRGGGRSHQGVDMMSPGGTPLVAVVAGNVTMKTTSLGGNSAWLNGVDGARYFYAHLSAWEGPSRAVSAGEVIGYVGRTGNTTANHLHFEIHPGGGAAINPTPTVRRYC